MLDEEISIDKNDRTPLYTQIKENLKDLITTGRLQNGSRLPTERRLASMLEVSRNTVSTAYRELESEGYLQSQQGRGTFIAAQEDLVELQNRKEKLLRIIDLAIEEALELGFTISEFVSLTHLRAREESEFLRKVKVAFIECNQEQLNFFARKLKLGSGIAITPMTLSICREEPDKFIEVLNTVDLVVTTFYHYEQVQELIGDRDKEVLSVSLEPQLQTIVRIARIPNARELGLVSISENFAREVEKSLGRAGLDFLKLRSTISSDQEELMGLIDEVDALITSPNRFDEVKRLVPPGKRVIEFVYELDKGSVNLLKSRLVEIKKQRRSQHALPPLT